MNYNNKETFKVIINFGKDKHHYPTWKTILSGVMGAFYIGLVYIAYHKSIVFLGPVNGHIFGSLIFPLAIVMIVLLGGSLFTSDILQFAYILEKRKNTVLKVFVNLLYVLIGNYLGSFIIAALGHFGGFYDSAAIKQVVHSAASHKMELTPVNIIIGGIICNVLVAGSTWMAMSTESTGSKVLILYLPIVVFAFMGFQHIVANSYAFLIDLFINARIFNYAGEFYNLSLALIGNFIGGVLVFGVYYLMYSEHINKTKKEVKK